MAADADIMDAARVMARHGIGIQRLLVVEGELLRGIVSSLDFVRALADGRIPPPRERLRSSAG